MIAAEKARLKGEAPKAEAPVPGARGPKGAKTCRELLEIMPQGFNAAAAGDMKVVYQFEISGTEHFTAHLRIADGKCTFHDGPAERPDVVVKSPAEVWLAISRGELDGQSAFMGGQYKVEGDVMLLLKLKDLFSRRG